MPVALSLVRGETDGSMLRPIEGNALSIDARTNGFRLDWLNALLDPELARDVSGLVSLDLALRGDPADSSVRGHVRLKDGKVTLARLGAKYRADVSAVVANRELRLTEARVRSSGGAMEAQGTVRRDEAAKLRFDLTAQLRSFQLMSRKDLASKVTGNLHLGGTEVAPTLTGRLTTHDTHFYLTASNAEHADAEVELTQDDLQVLERRFGYLMPDKESAGRGPFDAAKLDLDVTLGANNWIRRRSDPVVAVELEGGVKARKEPAAKLQLFGSLRALPGRSFVDVLGRRFELRRGGARLDGPPESAQLDLGAEYQVGSQARSGQPDVTITADVRADTGSIAVTLGSNPTMDRRDIISYLLTGSAATTNPTTSTATGDPLTTGTSLAVGAALGSLAGGAGQELGFDVVQILQDLQGVQTLVAGKYVSPTLYVGFRQPLTESTTDDLSESVSDVMEFEVEYAAFRRALLNLQGAGSEFRIFLRLRGGT
jgi:autotransporter translocation and assembly factor TamB